MEELSCRFPLLHPVEKCEIAAISLSLEAVGGGDGHISVSIESETTDRFSCSVFFTRQEVSLFLSALNATIEGGQGEARIKDYESHSNMTIRRQDSRFCTLALTTEKDLGNGCMLMSSISGALVEQESVYLVVQILRRWLRVHT